MKTKRKAYSLVVGTMLLLSIIVIRFGKHLKPRQAENIFEVIVETVDDLGKIGTIIDALSENADSLEQIHFLTCFNNLNFFSRSYSYKVDSCYTKALKEANKNNSTFSDVLIKLRKPLNEIKDNHYFFIGIDTLLLESVYVDFDSVWDQHFSRPSTIDSKYKQVLYSIYQSKSATRKSIDSTDKLFRALDKTLKELQIEN